MTLHLSLLLGAAAAWAAPVREVRNYQVVTQSTASDSTSPKSLTVSCPAGTTALTGGASTPGGVDFAVSESKPGAGSPPTSWTGSARELVDTPANWDLRVDVVCGEVSGYERVQLTGPQSTDADQFGFLECPSGKTPFSGGVGLSGAPLRQILTGSHFLETLITSARWQGNVDDFGSTISTSPWGLDIHTICSDSSRQEYLGENSAFMPGTPRSIVLNCLGGKRPIGGGAYGGDGGLAWSRPKDGAPGEPPVGWDAQARGSSSWTMGANVECAPLADPTVAADGLLTRHRAEFDAYDSWAWAHGTLMNGVGFAAGVEGAAWSFDGGNDRWVSIPSWATTGAGSILLYPAADFTVSAWINTGVTPASVMSIATLYDLGGTDPSFNFSYWSLYMGVDAVVHADIRSANINSIATLDGPTLNDGAWHHVLFVRNLVSYEIELWIDGALADSAPMTGSLADNVLEPGNPATPDPVSIGAGQQFNSQNVTNFFDGEIDEFAYWDRALTADEIRNLAGCHRDIGPRVLNLTADRFTSPAGAGHELCVYLEAGVHDLTIVDPSANPDAQWSGWSPGPTSAWGTLFSVAPEIDPAFVFGLPVSESSAQAAYDATTVKTTQLVLSQPQRVYFSLVDDTALDNLGGVSIFVPEPGFAAGLFTASLLFVTLAGRGREPRDRGQLRRCSDCNDDLMNRSRLPGHGLTLRGHA